MNENINGQNNFGGNRPQPFGGMNRFGGGNGQLPTFEDNQQLPTFEGNGQLPTFEGNGQLPTFEGNGQLPTFEGNQQLPTFGDNQPPQMWGNENLAGEEIFGGNNNFIADAPNDLSGVIDTSATDAFGFGEQKTFGNFAQGGLMPQMFGGRGGQFNQSQQPQQNQFK